MNQVSNRIACQYVYNNQHTTLNEKAERAHRGIKEVCVHQSIGSGATEHKRMHVNLNGCSPAHTWGSLHCELIGFSVDCQRQWIHTSLIPVLNCSYTL